jgi:hypothetical protein
VGVQHAHQQAAQPEHHHGGQQDAQQLDGQGFLHRIAARVEQEEAVAHHLRGEHGGQRGQGGQHQQHQVRNGGSQPPGVGALAAGQQRGEGGDKGRA